MFSNSNFQNLLNNSNLYLKVSPDWNSSIENHRLLLRKSLALELTQNGYSGSDLQEVLNLNKIPKLLNGSASISHCPLAGGWALSLGHEKQIGFDLEVASKISSAVVVRMGSEAELELAPGPAQLWAGKEATFKSLLGPTQPVVLSQIRITNWRTESSNLWQFTAQIQGVTRGECYGVVAIKDDLVMGISQFEA